jgi:hypothetical protein
MIFHSIHSTFKQHEDIDAGYEIRGTDLAQLLLTWINEWVDLKAMKQEKILIKDFWEIVPIESRPLDGIEVLPSCCQADRSNVSGRTIVGWPGNMRNLFLLWKVPDYHVMNPLRDVYGEEIAYFFLFITSLIRHFSLLCLLGVVFWICRIIYIDESMVHASDLSAKNHFKFTLGAFVLLWAAWFLRRFTVAIARKRCLWGGDLVDQTLIETEQQNYKPYLKDWIASAGFWVSYGCTLSYIIFAAATVLILQQNLRLWLDRVSTEGVLFGFVSVQMLTVTGITASVQFFGILWGSLVIMLTDLENHRKKTQYELSATAKFVAVKTFVVLWPFVYQGFFKKYLSVECADNQGALVDHLISTDLRMKASGQNWTNVSKQIYGNQLKDEFKIRDFLMEEDARTKFCVNGCYPVTQCTSDHCPSQCVIAISELLLSFFRTWVPIDLFFLAIPVAMSWLELYKERRKKGSFEAVGKVQTTAEIQAKGMTWEYGSWAGSNMDDFIEFFQLFAVVVCFGVVWEGTIPLAFVSFLVLYRVMAWRLAHVVRRGVPEAASIRNGIGAWSQLFVGLVLLGVICTAGMVCFQMYPFRTFSRKWCFALFATFEGFFVVIICICVLYKPTPFDVREANKKNREFTRTRTLIRNKKEGASLHTQLKAGNFDLLPKEDLNRIQKDLILVEEAPCDSDDDEGSSSHSLLVC